MEKDLKDFQLIELLDIKSLLPDYSDNADEDKAAKEVRDKAIAKIYDAIAKKLFSGSFVFLKPSTHELSNDRSIPLLWKNQLPLPIVRG